MLSLNTDVMFIKKCCVKKTTRKRPDKAISIFLPIEESISFIAINYYSKLMHKHLNNYFI
jgi:hypothetical protein|tara:strand:+ start:50 stop:229 length:180 start_codon:yes stop_codon:yes gene_type:complete